MNTSSSEKVTEELFIIKIIFWLGRRGGGQSRANIDFRTEYEYKYIRKVKFSIFIFEYPEFGDKYLNI